MQIVDTDGNIIDGKPGYTEGRLLNIDGVYTYVTWDECPKGTGVGYECGEQPDGEPIKLEKMQAQVDYTSLMTDTVLETEA